MTETRDPMDPKLANLSASEIRKRMDALEDQMKKTGDPDRRQMLRREIYFLQDGLPAAERAEMVDKIAGGLKMVEDARSAVPAHLALCHERIDGRIRLLTQAAESALRMPELDEILRGTALLLAYTNGAADAAGGALPWA